MQALLGYRIQMQISCSKNMEQVALAVLVVVLARLLAHLLVAVVAQVVAVQVALVAHLSVHPVVVLAVLHLVRNRENGVISVS